MWESDSGDNNNRPEAALKVSGLDEGEWKDKEGLSPDEYVSSPDEPDNSEFTICDAQYEDDSRGTRY